MLATATPKAPKMGMSVWLRLKTSSLPPKNKQVTDTVYIQNESVDEVRGQ